MITSPTVIVATTDTDGTSANTVLYLREDCGDATTELACNDDIGLTKEKQPKIDSYEQTLRAERPWL